MLARNELAAYIQDNYGTCIMGSGCCCLHVGWNPPCPHWIPVKATTWEELGDEMKKLYPNQGERS